MRTAESASTEPFNHELMEQLAPAIIANVSDTVHRSQWRRRLVASAFSILAATGITACHSGGDHNQNSDTSVEPMPLPVITSSEAPAPPKFTVGSEWDSNNCLFGYTAINNIIVASRPTNLCRSADPKAAGFYYLFARGDSAANWIEEVGSDASYSYWGYVDSSEFAKNNSTGQVLIDEGGSFVDFANWSATTLPIVVESTAYVDAREETAVLTLESQTYTPSTPLNEPPNRPAAQGPLQNLQQQYEQEQQKNADLQQQLANAKQQASSNGSSLAQQEELYLEQQNVNSLRIQTEPACDFSYNGCAP